MDFDSYNEVVNGELTYRQIAKDIKSGKAIIIGWTDEECTHFDIFFKLGANKSINNYLQRGLKQNYLFVGIVDKTFYGFSADSVKHWTYIAEKLRLGDNDCTRKVAELINGVIEELNREE